MNELFDRLFEAGVGGCSCLTKTPELQYHSPTCHFRLHEESRAEIQRLQEINAIILRDHTNLSNAIQVAGLTIEFEKGMPFITEPRKPRKVRVRQSK